MFTELTVKLLLKNVLNMSWSAVSLLLDQLLDIILQAEKKYGRKKGRYKAQMVKKWLKENIEPNKVWIINLLVELGVFIAKRRGLIV